MMTVFAFVVTLVLALILHRWIARVRYRSRVRARLRSLCEPIPMTAERRQLLIAYERQR